MKKIVVILDALKDTTLFDDSFFSGYQKKTVLPPFSFKPEAAFLTGHPPEITNSGTMYHLDEDKSKFKNIPFLNLLPNSPVILKKLSNRILVKYLTYLGYLKKNEKIVLGNIPFKILPYFSLANDVNLFDSNTKFEKPTIFNKLKKNKKKYFYIGIPFTNGSLEYVKAKLSTNILNHYDRIFIYISDLDMIGHEFGGNSYEYYQRLDKIIKYITSIGQYYSKNKINSEFIIFGDHGMADVKRTYNIQKILSGLEVLPEKDYLFFLDSTLARFWFKNEKSKKIIKKSLKNNLYGSWISKDELNKYQINFNHNKFGDEIWWASEGTLISPNFWQGRNFIKGMHGYRNEAKENHTMILSKAKYFSDKRIINMMEINQILVKFLELD